MMNFERENSSVCERADDLISVLYGEANEREQREFEMHLKQCGSCRAEFAAFSQVRESIGEWRDEALGGFVSFAPALAPVRKSALAAWRQFFALSPLWMKGAVAFAAVIFCVLMALAVGRLRAPAGVPPVAVAGNPQAVYSEQDMRRIVQQELAKQEAARQELAKQEQQQRIDMVRPIKLVKPSSTNSAVVRGPKSRRPFSRAERNQLAAELRLLSTSEENDLELPDK